MHASEKSCFYNTKYSVLRKIYPTFLGQFGLCCNHQDKELGADNQFSFPVDAFTGQFPRHIEQCPTWTTMKMMMNLNMKSRKKKSL